MPTDVPARRETTALRKLIAPHVSEVNGTQCWWCSFCRGEWFDDEGEVHTDNCPYVAAEAELAAIERQREEHTTEAEYLSRIVRHVRDYANGSVDGVLVLTRMMNTVRDRDRVHAARLSAPPAATEKDDG